MSKEEIMKRAEQFADAIEGLELMEAVDVFGQGCIISTNRGKERNDKREMMHAMIGIYYIGKLIEEVHGRSALVKINDNGSLSFSLGANGVEQKII